MSVNWSYYANFYDKLFKLKAYKILVDRICTLSKQYSSNPHKIAEVGCGTGNIASELTNHFRKASFTFIDNNISMLEKAKLKNYNSTKVIWILSDANDMLNLKLGDFDLIVLNNVLYTIENKPEFLNKIKSHMNSNSILLISDPIPSDKYNYFKIIKPQFKSLKLIIELITLIPSLIYIYKINRKIDNTYIRHDKNDYLNIFKTIGLEVIHWEKSYNDQANLFVMKKSW